MVQFGEQHTICVLEPILMVFQAGVMSEWANDVQCFLLEHFNTIHNSPSHIYHSALPLSPSSSWFYKHYIAEASPMVKVVKGLSIGWGVCSQTTLLSSRTLSLSHHGNSIAVGSQSGDIIILDAITGSQSAVLSGHTEEVNCVVFSSDGTSLVSGGDDKTIKLWDIQTGGVVKTFLGHSEGVWSVSTSADFTTIASGSYDKRIHLWNIQTGECYHTIQQQQIVFYVMISPKGLQHLISISDRKVWQWDANGCLIRPPFDGYHVSFSSDGAQFASCFEKTITVHNSNSGAITTQFQVTDNAHRCCFSPDNKFIVVAVNITAYWWDITTSEPQLVETFICHTKMITSLIFSSSTTLISASEDNSVKFWQIGAQSTDQALIDLKSTSVPSAPIKSVALQSKEGIAIICDLDGVIASWDISSGICKTSSQTPTNPSCMRDAQVVNGGLIIVWHIDEKIHAWDAENGELLWEVDLPWSTIDDLRISGDRSRVFALYDSSIWAWSLQTGEVVWKMETECWGDSESLIVDGSKVWVRGIGSNCKGWDFGIPGSTPMEFPNTPMLPSPSRLWDPKQASIKNSATGEVVFQLSRSFTKPVKVQCDDSYLVAGYQSGEILILDLKNVK